MKTYILYHDHSKSIEYAKDAAKSCDDLGISYELYEGYGNIQSVDAARHLGVISDPNAKDKYGIDHNRNKASLCSLSHAAIWKKMAEEEHDAIILEHDAIMLHKFELDIPDGEIVQLGYKVNNIQLYDHLAAGKPQTLRSIVSHSGSHAYALTHGSAKRLWEGIKQRKGTGCIDQHVMQTAKFRQNLSMSISDPICALGWLRDSTIWNKASQTNKTFISSFGNNYESK